MLIDSIKKWEFPVYCPIILTPLLREVIATTGCQALEVGL